MDEQLPQAAEPIWLTPDQAAARAQMGRGVIYREVRAGRLRAARIGGRRQLRIKPSWIDAWLEMSSTPVEVFPR